MRIKKCEMIDNVYSMDKIKNYFDKVKRNIENILKIPDYELGRNQERLRKIFNIPIIPKEIYEENKTLIEENYKKVKDKNLFRGEKEEAKDIIKDFIVDLSLYKYRNDYKDIENIKDFEFDKITKIKFLNYEYSSKTGLGKLIQINNIL
jgi:CRISPR-associated endonuclease/helicase Cas3